MIDADELDSNPLFHALQTSFRLAYDSAQEKCFTICIPQGCAIEGVPITQGLVDTHILRPSPYVDGQMESTDPFNSKVVVVDEDNRSIRVISGFTYDPPNSLFKILAEEMGYNKDYRPFKIFILDRVLDLDSSKSKRRPTIITADPEIHINEVTNERVSFGDHKQFLRRFPEHSKPLKNLNEKIDKFFNSFMIIPGYLNEAAVKVKRLVDDGFDDLFEANSHRQKTDPRFRTALKQSVESFVLGQVHCKIFPVLCEEFSRKSKPIVDLLDEVRGWDLDLPLLGVRPELCQCTFTHTLNEVNLLDTKITPLERLHCMKQTLDSIVKDVETHQLHGSRKGGGGATKQETITINSDDLIPLLCAVITKSRCKTLVPTLDYLDRFMWCLGNAKDGAAFTKTTFEAAVQYLQSCDFETMISVKKRKDSLLTTRSSDRGGRSIVTKGSLLGHYNQFKPEDTGHVSKTDPSSVVYEFDVTPPPTPLRHHFLRRSSSSLTPPPPLLPRSPSAWSPASNSPTTPRSSQRASPTTSPSTSSSMPSSSRSSVVTPSRSQTFSSSPFASSSHLAPAAVSPLSAAAMMHGPTPVTSTAASPSTSPFSRPSVAFSLRSSFRASKSRVSTPPPSTSSGPRRASATPSTGASGRGVPASELERDLDAISRMISSTATELDTVLSLAQEQKSKSNKNPTKWN